MNKKHQVEQIKPNYKAKVLSLQAKIAETKSRVSMASISKKSVRKKFPFKKT